MVDFNFSQSQVNFYDAEFDFFKNSPKGEIGIALRRNVGNRIVLAAKRDVGVDTGTLRETIKLIHERVGQYQELRIGSDSKIALLHHNGTRAHEIHARNTEFLRFSSRGRVVYTRSVRHPGTKPNPYLAKNLYLAYV